MPRLSIHPVPKKRFHGGRWRIYWKWNTRQFTVATDHTEPKKRSAVDVDLRLFSAALAMDRPVFPEAYQNAPAVIGYMAARFPKQEDAAVVVDSSAWLTDYEAEIMKECSPSWARDSISRLKLLETTMDGLHNVIPSTASAYLADFAATRKTGTRNRTLCIFSRFFKWAVRTERSVSNPFAGIKMLTEERTHSIIYCTPAEREELISLAQDTGWPEWLAIPIAFFTGMRREEITRLEWPDIRFREGNIIVNKSKTKIGRIIPLAKKLEELLLAIPEEKRVGTVVDFTKELARVWRLENLVRAMQKVKRRQLLAAWSITRPLPSRSKEYPAKRAEYEAQKQKRKLEIQTHLGRIGWNSFRHTFGSLLAQAGVSLDKISSWMGNTPEVCRRHYAQFIPRDRRDEEIDKL